MKAKNVTIGIKSLLDGLKDFADTVFRSRSVHRLKNRYRTVNVVNQRRPATN